MEQIFQYYENINATWTVSEWRSLYYILSSLYINECQANKFLILAFREEKITKPSLSENDLSAIKNKTFDILSEIIME